MNQQRTDCIPHRINLFESRLFPPKFDNLADPGSRLNRAEISYSGQGAIELLP